MFVPQKKSYRWFRGILLATFAGVGACLAPSCLYDKDTACGEELKAYGDNERCVCPADSVYTPQGCVQCGEHEVATAAGCQCELGYARPAAGEPCQEQSGAGGAGGAGAGGELGVECDPEAEPPGCEAPYDHCEPNAGTGYCTNAGCASSQDCDAGHACNDAAVCQRPPSGLGQSCTSDADCQGNEAAFCDTFMLMSCQVAGCSVDPDDCFPGYECCDLSAFGLGALCIPEGACM
jgi:hypothetical protein